MSRPLKSRIIDELDSLSQDQQKKLLDYMLSLKQPGKKTKSGQNLLVFSGFISKEDLSVMEKAIAEG